MYNTKNYTEQGGDVTHIGGTLIFEQGAELVEGAESVDGYNTKNYTEQGGDVTHIGGKLVIEQGAVVEGMPSTATLIEKSVTENGTYNATDDEADGYSKVTVNVEPDLTTKTITANGTYSAEDDNADGYSSVTVNVASENNANFINQPNVFSVKDNIESVEIPSGVTSLGAEAFLGCYRLKNVVIPDTVLSIGSTAFGNCSALETITINKPENSITGAPWAAPNTAQIIWNG